MSVEEVDHYLDGLDESKRSSLSRLRTSILSIVPNAEQGLSYGVPAFRLGDVVVAGFSAAANHLSYLPHSGSILATFDDDELSGFSVSKGALKFPVDSQLPDGLVARMIGARRAEADV